MNIKPILGALSRLAAPLGVLLGVARCGVDDWSQCYNRDDDSYASWGAACRMTYNDICWERADRFDAVRGCGVAESTNHTEQTSEADHYIPPHVDGDNETLRRLVLSEVCYLSCLWRVRLPESDLECSVDIYSIPVSEGEKGAILDEEVREARLAAESAKFEECRIAEAYQTGVSNTTGIDAN